jgi:molybdopterin molybdotransferase
METALLQVADALKCIEGAIAHKQEMHKSRLYGSEECALSDALGRVLAGHVVAERDAPPFDRSTRDGYAVRATEIKGEGVVLPVAGCTRAGEREGELPEGSAWQLMTGAPVPRGADAVVMQEFIEEQGKQVKFQRIPMRGQNIVLRGAEAQTGTILLNPGVRLGAVEIGLAASSGYAQVKVHKKPRVMILATGDELVDSEATPRPEQIRNANGPMLAALVQAAGGEPVLLGTAKDELEELGKILKIAIETLGATKEDRPNLLLIAGGVSVGRFDLVEEALKKLGADFHFTGVAMQPGKPLVFGEIPEAGAAPLKFFGLPGNPVSVAVTFRVFVEPLLKAMGGELGYQSESLTAYLADGWMGKKGLTKFLPAHCECKPADDLLPRVRLVRWHGSGDLTALARANCLVVIPEELDAMLPDEPVQVLLRR